MCIFLCVSVSVVALLQLPRLADRVARLSRAGCCTEYLFLQHFAD